MKIHSMKKCLGFLAYHQYFLLQHPIILHHHPWEPSFSDLLLFCRKDTHIWNKKVRDGICTVPYQEASLPAAMKY